MNIEIRLGDESTLNLIASYKISLVQYPIDFSFS